MLIIEKLISGGQTGVDRAALDLALELSAACGGWCPRGRRAEDGPLDPRYPLRETPSREYAQRTEWNVRDADGTLILHYGPLEGGTALTAKMARQLKRPLLCVDLDCPPEPAVCRDWVARHGIRVLNVAGPRDSKAPGIGQRARDRLRVLLSAADTTHAPADG